MARAKRSFNVVVLVIRIERGRLFQFEAEQSNLWRVAGPGVAHGPARFCGQPREHIDGELVRVLGVQALAAPEREGMACGVDVLVLAAWILLGHHFHVFCSSIHSSQVQSRGSCCTLC